MKKRVFAFALAVVFASLSFGTSSKAAEVNPIVQQLNAATGNYIGYDMTLADKVKVLTATYAASKTATSYTVHFGSEHRYQNWDKNGNLVPINKGSDYNQYLYAVGNDSAKQVYMNGLDWGTNAYVGGVCYGYLTDTNISKEEWLNNNVAQRNNAWSIDKAIDRGAFSIEYLAQNSTYQEINGVPYLVFTCNPTMDMLLKMTNFGYDDGESLIQNESTLTISFPLNNYGAFTVDQKFMIKAGPHDHICANGKYQFTYTYGNSNVNCTVLPALPANLVPVTQFDVKDAPEDPYTEGGCL